MKIKKFTSLYGIAILVITFATVGCSPLNKSVNKQDLSTASYLVAEGADVNKKSFGNTPISLAVYRNDTAMTNLLLDNGADINILSQSGWSPLNQAIYHGHKDVSILLIERGADTKIPNPNGDTPLSVAKEKGMNEVVAILEGEKILAPTDSLNIGSTKLLVQSDASDVVPTEAPTNGTNKKKALFSPTFRVIKPIPKWIWATAISPIETPSDFKNSYGKITNWGYGVGVTMNLDSEIQPFFDMTTYTYKLQIAEKGEDVNPHLGNSESAGVGTINLPLGAKYSMSTVNIRIGAKYHFMADKPFSPWIGAAYGVNVFNVRYLTWDEDKVYGKANGSQFKPAIMAGFDVGDSETGVFSVFFEAIGNTAEYIMEDLFGLGDYDTHGGSAEMGIPTPRVGISLTF